MPETISSIDITELAEVLEERKNNSQRIAVILGSRAGALFRSTGFYEELKEYSTKNFADMDEKSRFYECYSILEGILKRRSMSIKELRAFIEAHIREYSNIEHHLAELVKDNIFRVIITNNIDDILYESFKAVDMRENVDFVELSLGRLSCTDSIERILYQKKINIRRLIRIGGDIDTLLGNLNKPQAKKAIGECVRNLLEKLRIRELLIVGLDLAWDQSILSALPSGLETIWFVNEDEHVKEIFLEKCENVKLFRFLSGHKGNYQNFFKHLYWNKNYSITGSHKLIEEVKNSMYNMRINLDRSEKRHEKTHEAFMQSLEYLHFKVDSIMRFLEERFEK
jgi:hypothetical protein